MEECDPRGGLGVTHAAATHPARRRLPEALAVSRGRAARGPDVDLWGLPSLLPLGAPGASRRSLLCGFVTAAWASVVTWSLPSSGSLSCVSLRKTPVQVAGPPHDPGQSPREIPDRIPAAKILFLNKACSQELGRGMRTGLLGVPSSPCTPLHQSSPRGNRGCFHL